jgi:hypothetical protein
MTMSWNLMVPPKKGAFPWLSLKVFGEEVLAIQKMLPMRSTYPTARFLAIAACGEFTEPAREYVRSRDVELFYISKSNIVKAFKQLGLTIDYPDSLTEERKLELVNNLEVNLSDKMKREAFSKLQEIVGRKSFQAFKVKVASSLAAMPQEIKLYVLTRTGPLVFQTTEEVRAFLESEVDWSDLGGEQYEYVYDVVYTDGAEFSVTAFDVEELKQLHNQVETLERHMSSLEISW